MDESNANEELPKDPNDPLGFLILPIFGILLVAVVLLWLNQTETEETKKFFPVTGTITLDGKPLSGSFHVDFYPAEGSMNPVASSWIDQNGNFDLYSGQGGHYGAMPGEYRVVVKMMETEELKSWRIEYARNVKVEIDPTDGGTLTPPDPDPPFDVRYRDFETTPQRAIIGETENVINFDMPLFTEPKSRKKNKDQNGQKEGSDKESKNAESKDNPAEKESIDSPSSGPKATEPKATEPKATEPKAAEPKATELEKSESGKAESKTADGSQAESSGQ